MHSRLKKIREALGFTQREWASKLNISEVVSISRWENGSRQPNYTILSILANTYNINLHWLLTGHGEMFQKDAGHTDTASPTHEEIVKYFKDKELARLINSDLIKLEHIKPEALKEIYNYIRFKIQDAGGDPDEKWVWQEEHAHHLKNGTSGR